MIRAWIIFSTLVLSVIFRLWSPTAAGDVGFLLSDRKVSVQTWVYFTMEHINAIAIAFCIIIKDNTPRSLLYLFIAILCLDFLHYWAVYRDEGIGFNLIKVILFGVPLLYLEIKNQWSNLKQP